MPNISITGWKGHVGQELLKLPGTLPLMCDVRFPDEIDKAINKTRPDIIVHLASISDVDVCENPANEKLVLDTNVRGTFNVAQVAERYGCGVVLLSSAQVFDGIWGNYKEHNKPSPKNFYGHSKMGAESLQHLFPNMKIVRTSYLFDYARIYPHIYQLRLNKVSEQPMFMYRSFMHLSHFSEAMAGYLQNFSSMPDILHIAGSSSVSWYNFAKEIAYALGLDDRLVMARTYELKENVAPRPYKASLNVGLSKRNSIPQFSYQDGLQLVKELL
jgi:dTDP-4-dehydrorhamnose reductase